jgi:hypothetical protein
MGEDRPRYYRDDLGPNAYWCPGKFGVKFGFQQSVALGPAGAEAKAAAIVWNGKLDAARTAKKNGTDKPAPKYKPGTLGSFYVKFTDSRTSEAWAQMEPRTREDYHRAWPRIERHKTAHGVRFCDLLISQITPQISERFHVELHPAHDNAARDPKKRLKLTANEAFRTLKVWRTLMTALCDYRVIPLPPPIGRISNPEPKGASGVWLHDEVMQLAWSAALTREFGMIVAIRIAWDAMLSPEDVWALPLAGWIYRPGGAEVNTARAKTDKAVHHAISDDVAELVELYLAFLRKAGADMNPDLPLVRKRVRIGDRRSKTKIAWAWRPIRDKDDFGKVFRPIREAAFPGDERTFLDLRRSAMTEARMGGATKDDLGKAAANRIDANPKLEATYLHAASRNVLSSRLKGRAPMASKFGPTEG